MKYSLLTVFSLSLTSAVFGQSIGTFNSVQPTAQTQNLVLPSTHTFQRIIRSGATLSSGEMVGNNLDFSGYVPISGSSTNGYLSISNETTPAGVSVLSISLDPGIKLWSVNSGANVSFPFADLGTVRTFCSGTVTPTNHIIVCEETATLSDENGDGYNDDGWMIEIDPVTRTVINQDGAGGADKLWAMGRQKHEDIVISQDQSVVYWSADDAANGFVYKFVPAVAGNFSSGSLYVLQTTAALGTGTWQLIANTTQAERNNTVALSNAAGAYNFSRVEGIEFGPDGKVYFPSTTSGNVYRFRDLGATVDELEVFVASTSYDVDGTGPYVPEPWGLGADNIAFDGEGNLWVLQDGDRSHIWVVSPDHTADNPKVRLFATTPAGSEPTGITFSPDYKYLFMSIQHPDANTTPQTDAAGNNVVFDQSTTIVIARKENLGAAVLPVKFISLGAKQTAAGVNLNWELSAPVNGLLEVQRSVDGIRFSTVKEMRTSATTSQWLDGHLPAASIVYYRLRVTESNGNISVSKTIALPLTQQKTQLQLYPSLAGEHLTLAYYADVKEKLRISIVNAAGAVLKQQITSAEAGQTNLSIQTSQLAAGIYYVVIEQAGKKKAFAFTKQ